ncbi:unnamed protein product [Bursaphelenchus okinawaensis]|uniref:Protein sleepless n=1 Tax=Bursaphelenchus okinawaensis TaxID=465554 RepID=A0A811JR74_9BILA|nr:unnamed protein product [Bursaphelenchus okinawaensis]CAG9079241.1 unnamed protein product [Bursaphelenchus okinawaensis]
MVKWLLTLLFLSIYQFRNVAGQTVKCYSCASENMRENFLNRARGPTPRIAEPKIYDNMCDLDLWLLREKGTVDCKGPCVKWQQVLNNSGVLSYATIRGCFYDMFKPENFEMREGQMSHCRYSTKNLECLDYTQVKEDYCECLGDYCNSSPMVTVSYIFGIFSLLYCLL